MFFLGSGRGKLEPATNYSLVLCTMHGDYIPWLVDIPLVWQIPTIHGGYLPSMVGIYHVWQIPPLDGRYPPYMGDILILDTPHVWWVSTIQEGYLPTMVDTHHAWCIILDCIQLKNIFWNFRSRKKILGNQKGLICDH